MTTLDQQIRTAWDATDRRGELNRAVERAAETATLQELDAALGRLLVEVREAGADDDTEEIINEVGDRLHGWCHESGRIRTRPTVPSAREMSVLPRWARVAFAARCARRVLPLFRRNWPDAPLLHETKLTSAVELSEISASFAGQGGNVTDFARAGVLAAYVCDAVINAALDHVRATEVVNATALVFSRIKDVPIQHYEAVFPVVAHNASVALGNGIATSREDYDAASVAADAIIRNDFDRLAELAWQQKWTDETPVPPHVFDPLWPEGPPRNWPSDPSRVDGSVRAADSAGTSVLVDHASR